jgi:hypothetical protein
MKSFKGLSLHPHDAFKNIGALIEAAGILTAVTDEEYQELSDVIIGFVVSMQKSQKILNWRKSNENSN